MPAKRAILQLTLCGLLSSCTPPKSGAPPLPDPAAEVERAITSMRRQYGSSFRQDPLILPCDNNLDIPAGGEVVTVRPNDTNPGNSPPSVGALTFRRMAPPAPGAADWTFRVNSTGNGRAAFIITNEGSTPILFDEPLIIRVYYDGCLPAQDAKTLRLEPLKRIVGNYYVPVSGADVFKSTPTPSANRDRYVELVIYSLSEYAMAYP